MTASIHLTGEGGGGTGPLCPPPPSATGRVAANKKSAIVQISLDIVLRPTIDYVIYVIYGPTNQHGQKIKRQAGRTNSMNTLKLASSLLMAGIWQGDRHLHKLCQKRYLSKVQESLGHNIKPNSVAPAGRSVSVTSCLSAPSGWSV